MYLRKQFLDWEVVKEKFTFHSSYFSCFSLNIFHIIYLQSQSFDCIFIYLYCVHVCVDSQARGDQTTVEVSSLLLGCRFPGTTFGFGMCLYLLEHFTNHPNIKTLKNQKLGCRSDERVPLWLAGIFEFDS